MPEASFVPVFNCFRKRSIPTLFRYPCAYQAKAEQKIKSTACDQNLNTDISNGQQRFLKHASPVSLGAPSVSKTDAKCSQSPHSDADTPHGGMGKLEKALPLLH